MEVGGEGDYIPIAIALYKNDLFLLLFKLQWLPVTHLSQYKISSASIPPVAHPSVSELLQPYTPNRQLGCASDIRTLSPLV